jgi:hypothetical protein
MGSTRTGEPGDGGLEFRMLAADIEEAISILHLDTARARAAIASQAAARAEVVARLETALQAAAVQPAGGGGR